jgi:hypothetical protein
MNKAIEMTALALSRPQAPAQAARIEPTLEKKIGVPQAVLSHLAGVGAEIKADRWLYVCIAAYAVAAGLLAAALGRTQGFHPFLYVGIWMTAAFAILAQGIVLCAAIVGTIRRPSAPLAGVWSELVATMRPRLIAGFLLCCAVAVFYGSFTSVKNLLPHLFAFDWDVRLADFEKALHLGRDPATTLAELFGPQVTLAIDFVYAELWFVLLLGISAWVATSTRYAHLRGQFFLTLFLCWIVLGNILAGLFLSGGPIFFGELTGDQARFSLVTASLDGTTTQASARYLWEASQEEVVRLGTGISAFPSMHISISVLLTLFLSSVDRRLGWAGMLFTAIMLIGSVRLGWHYAIDGYASIVLTLLAWHAVGWIRASTRSYRLRPKAADDAGSE